MSENLEVRNRKVDLERIPKQHSPKVRRGARRTLPPPTLVGMRWLLAAATAAAALLLLWLPAPASACNEAVCMSVVSKCALLRSCECEIRPGEPCECCDRCKKCLGYLLPECCSCVGLCPTPNATAMAAHESVVFELAGETVVPSLWESLTGEEDSLARWDSFTYPVDIKPSQVVGVAAMTLQVASAAGVEAVEQQTLVVDKDTPQLVTVNCTVAFLSQQMSRHKCKSNCATMGASAGRWFEDGCCECVGHHCQNYGVPQSRCQGEAFFLDGGGGGGGGGDGAAGDEVLLEALTEDELDQYLEMEEKKQKEQQHSKKRKEEDS